MVSVDLSYEVLYLFFKVSVIYESGKKCGEIPKELPRLGKALARGSQYKNLAEAVMQSPNLKKAVENHLCSVTAKECKKLCSTKDPSCFRAPTKDRLMNFSWESVGKELQNKAPLLHRCLIAAVNPSMSSSCPVRNPGICMAASILLKLHDKSMSLVPYVICSILKTGKTSKKVTIFLWIFK